MKLLYTIISLFLFSFHVFSSSTPPAPTIQEQCVNEFGKVGVCLNYASGKADIPSKECCTTVKGIKEANPVCLCYIIQQTFKGEATLRQMGIQLAKLVEIPKACKLVNSSISDCPKLLHIPPSSPDYAIFNNTSLPVGATPPKDDKPVKLDGNSAGLIRDCHFVLAALVMVFI